jgi:hypothetical protein
VPGQFIYARETKKQRLVFFAAPRWFGLRRFWALAPGTVPGPTKTY